MIVTPALLVLTPDALARLRRQPGMWVNLALLVLFGAFLVAIYSQTRIAFFVLLTPMLLGRTLS